ncbi:MAG: translation initiation factor IF-3, partial [Solirubrobacteraceae bacterium]
YKYEQAQKQKAARKHQQQITIREIKFRPKIAQNDYDTKKGHVTRFLRAKDKVKITIMFRGREVTHPERGTALLDRLAAELSELAVVEQTPLQDGRNMTMMLAPSRAILAEEKAVDGSAETKDVSGAALDHETQGDRPSTGVDRRATATDRPATATDRPATATDRPATGVDRPATATDRPATGVDRPVTGVDRPATATDRPATQGARPVIGSDRPAAQDATPAHGERNGHPVPAVSPTAGDVAG